MLGKLRMKFFNSYIHLNLVEQICLALDDGNFASLIHTSWFKINMCWILLKLYRAVKLPQNYAAKPHPLLRTVISHFESRTQLVRMLL